MELISDHLKKPTVKACTFTEWQTWNNSPKFDNKSFIETFDGGQSFAWVRSQDYLEGIFNKTVVRLRLYNKKLLISIPKTADIETTYKALSDYLALTVDFNKIKNELPWRSDPILKQSINAFPYLRILKQPLEETLFGFLCSSTKQIAQIKEIVQTTSTYYGKTQYSRYHSLPSWERIASLSETDLRGLKLGYRARYIHQTAQRLKSNPNILTSLPNLNTIEAKKLLLSLPGIGSKIADCILLFGLGRLESFPIDTWIEKILRKAYGLETLSTQQLQSFAKAHFGDYAGFAQQFLFAAARSGELKLKTA